MFRRLLLGACALILMGAAAHAQDKTKVVGYLTPAGQASLRDKVFRERLKDLGWIEDKNIRIEYRRGANDPSRLRALADELVRLQVDVLVAQSTPAVHAAKAATQAIPVVSMSADPVANGFVQSLSRPGGNITGISMMMPQLAGKRLELLRQISPKLARVAFLAHGGDPAHKGFIKEAQDAAVRLGMRVEPYIVRRPDEFQGAFDAMKKDGMEALIVQPLFINTIGQGPAILEQASRLKLLSISDGDGFADAGGLLFYGPDPLAIYRRLAVYVDRVLRGGRPAEMPLEQRNSSSSSSI